MFEGLKDFHEDVKKRINNGVAKEDFRTIAIEETAELKKAFCKQRRNYSDIDNKEDLLDSLADNILANLYYIYSCGMEEEVEHTIVKKHVRNKSNAKKGLFVHRLKFPSVNIV